MKKNAYISKGKNTLTNTPIIGHYFAGANSEDGFNNLFGQINDPNKAGFLYILKGGPGTGKSTLMKTIGKTFSDLGMAIEYFYCSSDCSSLDGVRLKDYNIAIVDGTAPHVTEAQMPGIRDRIINLGEFIGSGIKKHEKKILALLEKKKLYFDIAYMHIHNAANLYRCNSLIYSKSHLINEKTVARKILATINIEKTANRGKIRKLYLTAVADEGTIDLAYKNIYSRVITLSYNNLINGRILARLAEDLMAKGCDVTCFMEILSPNTISAIHLSCINAIIVQKSESILECNENSEFIKYNDEAIALSLKYAARAIAKAKKAHKKVESYYIPNMDFNSINNMIESLINEIKEETFKTNL